MKTKPNTMHQSGRRQLFEAYWREDFDPIAIQREKEKEELIQQMAKEIRARMMRAIKTPSAEIEGLGLASSDVDSRS